MRYSKRRSHSHSHSHSDIGRVEIGGCMVTAKLLLMAMPLQRHAILDASNPSQGVTRGVAGSCREGDVYPRLARAYGSKVV